MLDVTTFVYLICFQCFQQVIEPLHNAATTLAAIANKSKNRFQNYVACKSCNITHAWSMTN